LHADHFIAALDLEGAHVGIEDRDAAGGFGEGQAIELARRVEQRVHHLVELEIGFDLGGIEVIFLLADLFGVEAIVPRFDRDIGALGIGNRLHVGDFLLHPGDGSGPDFHHQVHCRVRFLRHRVGHPVMGVGLETEQLGAVGAQLQDLRDGRIGVICPAIVAAVDIGGIDFLAQVAPRAVLQKGLHHRAGVLQRPAGLALLFGGFRQRGDKTVRQSGQIGLVGQVDEGFLVRQYLVRKLVKRLRQFGIIGDQLLLVGVAEQGAIADQLLVIALDQPYLLGVKPGRVAIVIDRLGLGQQFRIERQLVEEGGDFRQPFALDLADLVIRQVAAVHAPDGKQIIRFVADQFHRLGEIFKGRGRRIVADHVHIGLDLVHRRLEGFGEVGDLDLIPGRNAVIGAGPGLEDAVFGHVGWRRLHRAHPVQFCCCHFFSMIIGQGGRGGRAEQRGTGYAQKELAGGKGQSH